MMVFRSEEPLGEAQHVDRADDAHLRGLHRILLIVDGRCRAGEVEDLVDLHEQRMGDVVAKQLEGLVAEQMLDIAPGAGEETVDAKEPGSRPQAAARTNGPLGTLTRRSTCIFPSIHAVGPGAQHPELRNGLLRKEEDVVVPDELKDRLNEKAVSAAVSGETKLLVSRRNGRDGQRSQFRERIEQTGNCRAYRPSGIKRERNRAHLRRARRRGGAAREESRVNNAPEALSETRRGSKAREDYIAQIAQVRGKISETELQILQLDQDFQTEVLKDLKVKSPN